MPQLEGRAKEVFWASSRQMPDTGANGRFGKAKGGVAGRIPRTTDRRWPDCIGSENQPRSASHEDHPTRLHPTSRPGRTPEPAAGLLDGRRPGSLSLAGHRRLVRHIPLRPAVRHQLAGHAARLGRPTGVVPTGGRRLAGAARHRPIRLRPGHRPSGAPLVSRTSGIAAPAQGPGGHRGIPGSTGRRFGGDGPGGERRRTVPGASGCDRIARLVGRPDPRSGDPSHGAGPRQRLDLDASTARREGQPGAGRLQHDVVPWLPRGEGA